MMVFVELFIIGFKIFNMVCFMFLNPSLNFLRHYMQLLGASGIIEGGFLTWMNLSSKLFQLWVHRKDKWLILDLVTVHGNIKPHSLYSSQVTARSGPTLDCAILAFSQLFPKPCRIVNNVGFKRTSGDSVQGDFLGIISREPRVSKFNRLHVDILQSFFLPSFVRYIL